MPFFIYIGQVGIYFGGFQGVVPKRLPGNLQVYPRFQQMGAQECRKVCTVA